MPNKELNNTVDNKIDEELYKQVMVICRDFVYCWRDKQVEIPEVMRVDLESRLKEFVPNAIKQREEAIIANGTDLTKWEEPLEWTISFHTTSTPKTGIPLLKIKENGEIYLRGELIATDKEATNIIKELYN